MDIPAGALSEDTEITVTVVDDGIPNVPGRTRVSYGYRYSPEALALAQPIRITLPYLEERVPKAMDPSTFDLRRHTSTEAFFQLASPSVRLGEAAVEATSNQLGLFWVTSPQHAAFSKLTLEPEAVLLLVGQTQQYLAKATDNAGNPVDVPLTWTVVPARVATVDATGLVTATSPGNATLTVQAGSYRASALVLVQGPTVGPTTFVHDNPFPTGNDLWGGVAVGGDVFFVGANGTVLSHSTGNEWARRYSAMSVELKAMAGPAADDLVAVGQYGTLGVLLEVKGPSVTPKLTLADSVAPRAVWYDGTHGMAVGDGNDVWVKTAGGWEKASSPSTETLLAVAGNAQGAFATVGNRGSLYRFDPTTRTWDSLFQTQLAVLLASAVFAQPDGSEAWAVGAGKLWHFEAGAWMALNLPATPVVTDLTAVGQVDGKLVIGLESGPEGYLWLYDATAAGAPDGGAADGGSGVLPGWTLVALRGPQVIRGVFSTGAAGYAVGDVGAVWKYAAGAFTEVSSGFYGNVADLAVTGSTVYAAVNECVTPACAARVGKVMQRTGPLTWAPLGAAQPFTTALYSVAVSPQGEVLAGGDSEAFRYDGTAWTAISLDSKYGGPLYDIQVCGTTVWAVGPYGELFSGTPSSLSSPVAMAAGDLRAIHCPTDSDIWVAGDGALMEASGLGQFQPRSSTTLPAGPWLAVWSPGPNEAFAFGSATKGEYWDTAGLNLLSLLGGIVPTSVNGLWGSSIDNLYAVGQTNTPVKSGFAIRFDGALWKAVDSGAEHKVTAIHGASATEIWLGTEGGGLLRGVPP